MALSQIGQGRVTTTALTNHSRYLTIIDDEKTAQHKKKTFLCEQQQQENHNIPKKGTRLMHTTTLILGDKSNITQEYRSNTKHSFSGKKDLLPCIQRRPYPSQHKNHFVIGDKSMAAFTEHPKRFNFATIQQNPHLLGISQTHRAIGFHQMKGSNMLQSLSHNNNKIPRRSPTNSSGTNVINQGSKSPDLKKVVKTTSSTFDVIRKGNTRANHHCVSGNKFLQRVRESNTENFLS
ncbi:uncharacterized protein [Clytia hemisphaerica]|uniref:Uncharacterized protein n=1 Tax=Clytia hemisphaerica TaxID=252671 RepID=A0A7M5XHS9_9CNID